MGERSVESQRTNNLKPPPVAAPPIVGRQNGVTPPSTAPLEAARDLILGLRADGQASSREGIAALLRLVSTPADVFAAEAFLQTGVVVRDPAEARMWAAAIEALSDDAQNAYDIVIRKRGGAGLRAVLDKKERAPLASPDFYFAMSNQSGPIKFKGGIKLDPLVNGIQIKDDLQKLQLAPVSGQMENLKSDISIALLKESLYLGTAPAPFDSWRVDLQGKLLDKKLSEDLTKLKILTIAFVVKGELPATMVPEVFRGRYKLVCEFSVEHSITPDDLTLLTRLGGMVDEALEKGAEILKWEDKLKTANRLVAELKAETAALEKLKPKWVRGKLVYPEGYRGAQAKLARLRTLLRLEESTVRTAQKALPVLRKAFEVLHTRWLDALGKLSPLLARFRGPIATKIAARLAVVFGSRLIGAVHPFLLIVMAVIDVLYLLKFLIDLYRGKLTYVGFGNGDYEPSLLDWEAAPGPDAKTGGGGGVDSDSDSDADATVEESPNRKKLAALGGPRARLADVLLRDGFEQTMDQRHFDRLIAILESHDITPDDVDKVMQLISYGMTPDQALDALARYLSDAKADKTGKTPKPTGDGKGDGDDTGGGRGSQRRSSDQYLGPDDGGEFVPRGTFTITLFVAWGTYAVITTSPGNDIRIKGIYRKRKDGAFEFVPRETGVRVIYEKTAGEDAPVKVGELLVDKVYVMRK